MLTGKHDRRTILWVVLLALVLALSIAPGLALAQDTGTMAPAFVAQIAPNAVVEIPVHGFCLDYGLPFPGASLAIGDVTQSEGSGGNTSFTFNVSLTGALASWRLN